LPRRLKKPGWLVEFRKRIRLIEIIERAFEVDCDCEVVRALREVAGELGEVFISSPPPVAEVGRWPQRVRGRGSR